MMGLAMAANAAPINASTKPAMMKRRLMTDPPWPILDRGGILSEVAAVTQPELRGVRP